MPCSWSLLVTLVALVPGLLLLTTTFPRFLVVLGLARQGLGLNTTPPNQVLAGLAAFLTLFVMGPTFSKINETAIQPAIKGEITQGEAVKAAWVPMQRVHAGPHPHVRPERCCTT